VWSASARADRVSIFPGGVAKGDTGRKKVSSSSLRWRVGCTALVATVVLIAREGSARAAASARLFYGRSPTLPGCADEAALRRAIALRVGYDPIFPLAPNSVAVSITREGEQLVADVKLTNREGMLVGSRTLRGHAAQCGELTDTIALTVAIALDTNDKLTPSDLPDSAPAPPSPGASANPPEGAPAPPPAPPPAPAVDVPPSGPRTSGGDDAEASPANQVVPAPSSHLELGAAVSGVLYGVSPSASLGVTAAAALRWSRLSLGIEGWGYLPSSAPANAVPGAQARTSLAGAGPTACLHFGEYFGCVVGIIGSLRAEAPGVPGASTRSAVDVLAGLRAGVELPLASWLSLRVSLDLLADPGRPTVEASGQPLWQAPLLAAASQLGLAVRIP
jgi:hypothetical protein